MEGAASVRAEIPESVEEIPPPSTAGSSKRPHDGAADDGEPDTKRARLDDDTTDDPMHNAISQVAQDPAHAGEVVSQLGGEAMKAVKGACDTAEEMMSPFNELCPAFAVFGVLFCKHVLRYVDPVDTCALRLQSRAVRDWVDQSGRVSLKQITTAIASRVMFQRVPRMLELFLDSTDNPADIYYLVASAAVRTGDADTSAQVIERVLSDVKTCIPGMSHFFTLGHSLFYNSYHQITSLDTDPMKWSELKEGDPLRVLEHVRPDDDEEDSDSDTDDSMHHGGKIVHLVPTDSRATSSADDSENMGLALDSALYGGFNNGFSIRASDFEGIEVSRQDSILSTLRDNLFTTETRISVQLLKVLLSRKIIGTADIVHKADKIMSALVYGMATTELAGLSIDSDVSALEYLLEVVDDHHGQPLSFTNTTFAITQSKVSAPLIDILRVPLIEKRRSAGPLTHAAKRNNPTALRYIARRALAQGILPKSQARVVTIAMREGNFDCVRVLAEEFFTVAPNAIVKLMIVNELPWSTDAQKRGQAFDAILTDVGMCISRGFVDSMIKSIDAAMDLKIQPNLKDYSTNALPRMECDTWASTIAGDFLSALWKATSGDPRLRSVVTNSKSFRTLVDRALIAHIECKFKTNVFMNVGGDVPVAEDKLRDICKSDAMAALLSRIAELFDMQRRSDLYVDLDDDNFYEKSQAMKNNEDDAPEFLTTLSGMVFDRWLRTVLALISVTGWCFVDAAAAASGEIANIMKADVVNTDNTFRLLLSLRSVHARLRAPYIVEMLHKSCGTEHVSSTDLARRLLRLCGIVIEVCAYQGEAELPLDMAKRLDSIFDKIAKFLTDVPEKKCVSLADLLTRAIPMDMSDLLGRPTAAADGVSADGSLDDVTGQLRETMRVLSEYVVDTCGEELGGVQILYMSHKGDLESALAVLTEGKKEGPSIPEPEGDVRDIVIYALASRDNKHLPIRDTMALVEKMVGAYTTCVTLPSSWHALGRFTLPRVTKMAHWVRDLMRGRKPHTVWWGKRTALM